MKFIRLFSPFVSVVFIHGLLGMEVEGKNLKRPLESSIEQEEQKQNKRQRIVENEEDNKLITLGAEPHLIQTHMSKRSGQEVGKISPGGLKTLTNCFPPEIGAEIAEHLMENHPVKLFILQKIAAGGHSKLEDWIESVACSPDGSKVVTGSDDRTAKIWRMAISNCLGSIMKNREGSFSSMSNFLKRYYPGKSFSSGDDYVCAWSLDGSKVITGSGDGTAKIWNADTGNCMHTLTGHNNSVTSVAWSPDDSKVITVSKDGTAKIWNAATGDCLHAFRGHNSCICLVAWSPDGSKVITGSFDMTAKIWDVSGLVGIENSLNKNQPPSRDLLDLIYKKEIVVEKRTFSHVLLLDIIYREVVDKEKKLILSPDEKEIFDTFSLEVQSALEPYVAQRSDDIVISEEAKKAIARSAKGRTVEIVDIPVL